MCIKDSIKKTCWKNGKDLSNRAPNIKLWNHTKKRIFRFLPKISAGHAWSWKFFFCQFPNPWTLRVSRMGGFTSKCEKKSKSLHPTVHPHWENDKIPLLALTQSTITSIQLKTSTPRDHFTPPCNPPSKIALVCKMSRSVGFLSGIFSPDRDDF